MTYLGQIFSQLYQNDVDQMVSDIPQGHPYFWKTTKKKANRAINQRADSNSSRRKSPKNKEYFRHQDLVTVVCHNKTYHSSGVPL